jgi:outer membrane protein, heavy metal efflux system
MRSPRSRAWVVAACLTACVVPLHAQPVGSAPVTTGVADGPVYSLPALIELARRDSPALAAARARVSGADAGRTTARARPNPEIEFQAGRQSASGGAISGASGAFGVLQPLERGALREARLDAATALAETVRAEAAVLERDRLAELELRYVDVLRLQAAARLAVEDLATAEQIRSRVQVRVSTGEAPRFELIRADTERLNAQRAVQAAAARVDLARAELRRLVGPGLPVVFSIAGSIDEPVPAPPALESLRAAMQARHPELVAARASVRNAEARVALEQQRRRPSFAVRAGVDRVPETVDARIGLVVQLPVFDRREGPLAEAAADVERARFELADRSLQLEQSLDAAWQRYRIALEQVAAYESGLLGEAEAALRVAEAAYRFGERGILDYLDAQRTLRTLRNELNATRFELRAARVELERLRAESE